MEVMALADVLWFVPRPARRPIADKLHGLGVRVHPELATLQVETPGPKQFANITPQHVVAIDKTKGLEFLRGAAEQTGDRNLADLADRIEAADTEEKMAAERARLAPQIPDAVRLVGEHLDTAGDSIE
ncbi:hypothetical protein A5722_05185 [Mycobacterium vulneris]|nr:hypothetical protein A5722_05185 [Mycolicibacterium vulneris]OCB61511.1 hypothetical protein A5729_03860 [Mycolicibacterium vulneris]